MNSDLHSSGFRNYTHSIFGIALAKVKKFLKNKKSRFQFRNCTHSEDLIFKNTVDKFRNLCITLKISLFRKFVSDLHSFRKQWFFGFALIYFSDLHSSGFRNCTREKTAKNPLLKRL